MNWLYPPKVKFCQATFVLIIGAAAQIFISKNKTKFRGANKNFNK